MLTSSASWQSSRAVTAGRWHGNDPNLYGNEWCNIEWQPNGTHGQPVAKHSQSKQSQSNAIKSWLVGSTKKLEEHFTLFNSVIGNHPRQALRPEQPHAQPLALHGA